MRQPEYFERIRASTAKRWDQLEADPGLAGPWHQLFKQVQSPRHVVSELLQNADDAGATWASTRIEGNHFLFEHDGADFTEENFASLCGFGYSNKRNLHTIGFRGIGFKSTFSLGDTVRLTTPTLSVEFHRSRFTEPKPSSSSTVRTTVVRVQIKDELRKKELAKNLNEWTESSLSLLFFRNISSLEISGQRIIRKSHGEGPVPNSEWVRLSAAQSTPYLLIRAHPESFPSDAVQEIREERMGSEELELPPCGIDIVLGPEKNRLFVILPTGVAVDLPFTCNAPFMQDPARVKIKDPGISATNRWLLERAGRVAAEAMLAWLARTEFSVEERSRAYALFPNAAREENSLEGSCETICEEAFVEAVEETRFLLTDAGALTALNGAVEVPAALYEIWTAEQLSSLFDQQKRPVLSRWVSETALETLSTWDMIETKSVNQALDVVESTHVPKPGTWTQLLALWDFVSEAVRNSRHYSASRRNLHICPVQGSDVLYSASEVVRLGERKLLESQDDWRFLSENLRVLNQNWLRFLADQRRIAADGGNKELSHIVEDAYVSLATLGLADSSDVDQVIQRVATAFFKEPGVPILDCVRLTHIAAKFSASVPPEFQYVSSQEKFIRPVDSQIVADEHGDLDLFFDDNWLTHHRLHPAYDDAFESCTREEWRRWRSSEKSRLLPFAAIGRRSQCVAERPALIKELRQRGFDGEPEYHYKHDWFEISDFDFDPAHWEHWERLAQINTQFWGLLATRILELPPRHFAGCESAAVSHVSTSGKRKPVTWSRLLPRWILQLREKTCLPDTFGRLHLPAELLLRTPATEALRDIELFVSADIDTPENRPLLRKLGVRETPTGPERILERLRALSELESPPAQEVEKWYARLDQLFASCTTEQTRLVRETFATMSLILASDGEWCKSREVFLATNDADVPGAATIRVSVQHLSLWQRIGVADRPTAELALQWLGSLESGQKLSSEQAKRVRAIITPFAVRVWNELGHWLNLEGEWVPTDTLTCRLSMQSLTAWSNLFVAAKRRTADLRSLPSETHTQPPFSLLADLAGEIEERISRIARTSDRPARKPWMHAIGRAFAQVILLDDTETERVRALGRQLSNTRWQRVDRLEVVPYIQNTPAGTARPVDALWDNETLYVADDSVARSFRAIADELAKPFARPDVGEAIKACVERSEEFIQEYIEQNFKLAAEAPISDQPNEQDAPPIMATTPQLQKDDLMETVFGEPVATLHEGISAAETPRPAFKSTKFHALTETPPEPASLPPPTVISTPKPTKLRLIERFARQLGFEQDGDADRFYHEDGSWLQHRHGSVFSWERYAANGELARCYWVREHCLQVAPLEIGADVWSLCQLSPHAHALVLSERDERPLEITGAELLALTESGKLRLFPATYRLATSEV